MKPNTMQSVVYPELRLFYSAVEWIPSTKVPIPTLQSFVEININYLPLMISKAVETHSLC